MSSISGSSSSTSSSSTSSNAPSALKKDKALPSHIKTIFDHSGGLPSTLTTKPSEEKKWARDEFGIPFLGGQPKKTSSSKKIEKPDPSEKPRPGSRKANQQMQRILQSVGRSAPSNDNSSDVEEENVSDRDVTPDHSPTVSSLLATADQASIEIDFSQLSVQETDLSAAETTDAPASQRRRPVPGEKPSSASTTTGYGIED